MNGFHWNPHILGHTFKISQIPRLIFKLSENHPTSLRLSPSSSDTFKESYNTGLTDGLPWIETLSVPSRSRCLLTRDSMALIRVSYGVVMLCRSFLFWGGIDEVKPFCYFSVPFHSFVNQDSFSDMISSPCISLS